MNWKTIDNKLVRIFCMEDLSEIIKKLNRLDEIANEQNHHPDFCVFDYRKIRFELWTKDKKAITNADHKLASSIDELFASVS